MADFSQPGTITTLHALSDRSVESLERALCEWAIDSPISLIIPTLASEVGGTALPAILEELARVPYLDEVVIGLDAADRAGFDDLRRLCSRLPMPHRILWHDGPRLRSLADELARRSVSVGTAGKGRNVWWCFGHALASGRAGTVALHDADITTYSSAMLARLLYPVVHPGFGYDFAKGYYARIGDGRMNGRLSRLLVAPLLASLRSAVGPIDLLEFFAGFRYPLAGECAIDVALLGTLRVTSDWGLEVGLLADVYEQRGPRQVCQVDLADAYDHKHQRLSPDDPGAGLHRMAIDVAEALLRLVIIGQGHGTEAALVAVESTFVRFAEDRAEAHRHDAEMNGYVVDADTDAALVDVFARAVQTAGSRVRSGPSAAPLPTWDDVFGSLPDLAPRLVEAVALDCDA